MENWNSYKETLSLEEELLNELREAEILDENIIKKMAKVLGVPLAIMAGIAGSNPAQAGDEFADMFQTVQQLEKETKDYGKQIQQPSQTPSASPQRSDFGRGLKGAKQFKLAQQFDQRAAETSDKVANLERSPGLVAYASALHGLEMDDKTEQLAKAWAVDNNKSIPASLK